MKTKVKRIYEVVDIKTGEVIGHVDRKKMEYFCEHVGVGHKGMKGDELGFPGKFIYIRHEKLVAAS